MPGFYKNFLDFGILDVGNLKTFVFLDCSEYILSPEKPIVQIYLPGFDRFLEAPVAINQVNTFNANTLGLSASLNTNILPDLPDGIWKIFYRICPYETSFVEKNYMRVTFLNYKLQLLYNEISIEGCDCPTEQDIYIQKTLTHIHILIEGSKSVVNIDPRKASRYYALSNKLIDELSKKFCKNCNF